MPGGRKSTNLLWWIYHRSCLMRSSLVRMTGSRWYRCRCKCRIKLSCSTRRVVRKRSKQKWMSKTPIKIMAICFYFCFCVCFLRSFSFHFCSGIWFFFLQIWQTDKKCIYLRLLCVVMCCVSQRQQMQLGQLLELCCFVKAVDRHALKWFWLDVNGFRRARRSLDFGPGQHHRWTNCSWM